MSLVYKLTGIVMNLAIRIIGERGKLCGLGVLGGHRRTESGKRV